VMGRRGANQTAVFFAALGTALCGFSTSMEMLIVARFVSVVFCQLRIHINLFL
jgi:MFS family permease